MLSFEDLPSGDDVAARFAAEGANAHATDHASSYPDISQPPPTDEDMHPIVSANEMLERRPAGSMGDGAFFVRTDRGAIMPVQGDRVLSEADADDWVKKDPAHRYKTANYVPDGRSRSHYVIVCESEHATEGRYTLLNDVWDKCNKIQCKAEGE